MNRDHLRNFMFRGLMFEAEADAFRRAGIQIGANITETEENLLREALAPFGVSRRNNALEMARLYAVLFCFENEIRDFIREALEEKDGPSWPDKLPPKIREQAESRREVALKDSWLEGEKSDLLGFVEFGHLAQIIIAKWDYFRDVMPTQHWLKQRMDELEKARNFIAHNRMLLPSEFQRMYMYIADWNQWLVCNIRSDGRILGVPLAWFPRLLSASPQQRQAMEISAFGLHWEALDEDISVAGLLAGRGDQTVSRGRRTEPKRQP